VVEPLDQLQLVLDQISDLVWDTLGEPLSGPLQGERGEALLRRLPVRDRLLGIFVTQLVEAEPAALDDFEPAVDRSLAPAKARPPKSAATRAAKSATSVASGGKAMTI